VVTDTDIRSGLENLFVQPSAISRGGDVFPRAPIVTPTQLQSKYPTPVGQSDNGSYRQQPKIPASLPKGLSDRTGKPPVITKQYAPYNLPNPRPPSVIPQKITNTVGRVGNAASAVSGVITVGQSIATAARERDGASIAIATLNTASVVLLATPNPYAQGLGVVAALASGLINFFRSPENLKQQETAPNPNEGTRTFGESGKVYNLQFEAQFDVVNGTFVRKFARGRGGQINGFQGVISIGPVFDSGIVWACTGTDSQGSFGVSLDFESPGHPTQNAKYKQPNLVSITEIATGNPVTVPPPESSPNAGYVPNVDNDGWFPTDLEGIKERLDSLSDVTAGLSDGIDQLRDAFPQRNNGVTPRAENRTPQPALAPKNIPEMVSQTPLANYYVDADGNPLKSTDINGNPISDEKDIYEKSLERFRQNYNKGSAFPDGKVPTYADDVKRFQQNYNRDSAFSTPTSSYAPSRTPTVNTSPPLPKAVPLAKESNPATQTQQDRFKDPKDCQFSCENLAKCFVEMSVKVFDGCNSETGEAKTKSMTIQVLPKDKTKTEALFKAVLEIASKECSIENAEGKITVIPDYWLLRRGQVSQAVVLFKTTTKVNGSYSYYQLQIPHYTGSKGTKPSIPTYQKGEHLVIYECLDGSQMQVYAASEGEGRRVITALEKYINPRMRMKDASGIKTGKRLGLAKVTVKPIRLDFRANGQLKSSSDWSVNL
jgi:hypothetical protein